MQVELGLASASKKRAPSEVGQLSRRGRREVLSLLVETTKISTLGSCRRNEDVVQHPVHSDLTLLGGAETKVLNRGILACFKRGKEGFCEGLRDA